MVSFFRLPSEAGKPGGLKEVRVIMDPAQAALYSADALEATGSAAQVTEAVGI